MAETQAVPLTSLAIPAAELGELAVEMAMRQLDGQGRPEVRLLSPRITDRGSNGPAPA